MFPDVLDWTWGEIVDFIECKNKVKKNELRERAAMDFHLAGLICKMISAKRGTKFSVMDEYDFLWSQEEKNAAAMERFEQQMMSMCTNIKK